MVEKRERDREREKERDKEREIRRDDWKNAVCKISR
jgi:hypothetical protein